MSTDAIKSFMSRVRGATASKQSEVRLPISDAQQLAAQIGELMADRLGKKDDTTIEVKMDGGKL